MDQNNSEKTNLRPELFSFDPIIIFHDILKRWYIVIAVAIIAGLGSYVWTDINYVPEYKTKTIFVITTQGSSPTVYQNLTATSGLASVFTEVLNSSILKKSITDSLFMNSFDGTIEASVIPETNLITMEVTGHDPHLTFLITKKIIENHSVVSYQVLGDTVMEILQKPKVPTSPVNRNAAFNNMKRSALMAAIASILLMAFFSIISDKIRSKSEIEEKLDCYSLGEMQHERTYLSVLDLFRRHKNSIIITNPTISFSFSEDIRKLRHQIEQHNTEGGKLLLVTSTLENEGKSTLCVNLALSFAQKQIKTLLIDCDLRNPSCAKILNYDHKNADLSEHIMENDLSDDMFVKFRANSTLSVLLQKQPCASATEFINSDAMRSILENAAEKFDLIIVDSPPMSVSADAEYLASMCDMSIMVVEQNNARAYAINRGIDFLQKTKAKFLGCILNNCRSSSLSDQSSYSYGYGYGYGYGKYKKYSKYSRYGKYGKYGKYGVYAESGTLDDTAEIPMDAELILEAPEEVHPQAETPIKDETENTENE